MVVNCKRAQSHSLLHFLADLIPPYRQTLEFALSVARRGQIPSQGEKLQEIACIREMYWCEKIPWHAAEQVSSLLFVPPRIPSFSPTLYPFESKEQYNCLISLMNPVFIDQGHFQFLCIRSVIVWGLWLMDLCWLDLTYATYAHPLFMNMSIMVCLTNSGPVFQFFLKPNMSTAALSSCLADVS